MALKTLGGGQSLGLGPSIVVVLFLLALSSSFCAATNDTLASGWTDILYTGTAPDARSYHTTVADEKGRVYMFGGNTGIWSFDLLNDLHVYDIATTRWEKLTPWGKPPSPRFRHTAVYDQASRSMIVFGGATSPDPWEAPIFLNDVSHYHVDKNEWQSDVKVSGTPPSARVYHVAVASDGVMTIFGGNTPNQILNDVYKYYISERRWEKVAATGSVPIARSHASAVLYNNKMIIFGGLKWHGPEGYLNDVYSFDLAKNHWLHIDAGGSPPTRRVGHSAALIQDTMYIFAGYEVEGVFVNDLYALDLVSNEWADIPEDGEIPRKRFVHTAVVPPASIDTFLIFYGYSDELVVPAQNFDDVWTWRLPN